MNRFFGKLAKAAMIAAVLCLVAGGALANDRPRPYRQRSEGMMVGPCVLAGLPGNLWAETGNATHAGLFESLTCVIVTGGAFPVYTIAGEGWSTEANGDRGHYFLGGTVNVAEDPCVSEYTTRVVGGISHKGVPVNVTGEFQSISIVPWSAPGICGPEQTTTASGTITY